MKSASIVLATAAAVISALMSGSGSAQEPLRWQLKKGEKFTLQMKQQTNSTVSLSSRKLNSTVDLLVNVGWEVQSAEEDSFVIEQTIDAVRIEMKGPDQNLVTFDSREKKAVVGAAKDLQAAVASLLGLKFSLTMNSRGKISAAKRLSPETSEVVAIGEAGKAVPLSKEAIEQLLHQPLLPLPQEAIGSEQTWTDERQTKAALGEVKLTRTFKLAGSEERLGKPAQKIGIQGKLELTPGEAPKNAPKLKEQSHTGIAWFGKDPGRLIAIETTQRLMTESMYRDAPITVELTTTVSSTLQPRE